MAQSRLGLFLSSSFKMRLKSSEQAKAHCSEPEHLAAIAKTDFFFLVSLRPVNTGQSPWVTILRTEFHRVSMIVHLAITPKTHMTLPRHQDPSTSTSRGPKQKIAKVWPQSPHNAKSRHIHHQVVNMYFSLDADNRLSCLTLKKCP